MNRRGRYFSDVIGFGRCAPGAPLQQVQSRGILRNALEECAFLEDALLGPSQFLPQQGLHFIECSGAWMSVRAMPVRRRTTSVMRWAISGVRRRALLHT